MSLDGATPESHDWMRGVAGSFRGACDGIRNLVDVGLPVQIVMSVTRRTGGETEALVRLAERLGVQAVKLNFVHSTGRGAVMERQGETLGVDEILSLAAWVEQDLSRRTPLDVRFNHPLAFQPEAWSGDSRTCDGSHALGVLGDGHYSLCGMGENEPDLIFGDAARDPLEQVWREHPVLREIREGFPRRLGGVCARCKVRNRCGGHCLAQNYHDAKDLWSGYWFCEAALAQGLFPPEALVDAELASLVRHMDDLLATRPES